MTNKTECTDQYIYYRAFATIVFINKGKIQSVLGFFPSALVGIIWAGQL